MATAQSSQISDGSRSIIALLLSATPLYLFSIQARSRLGLDNLHLGLLQVLLLLIMGQLSSYIPSNLFGRRAKTKFKAKDAPASLPAAIAAAESTPTPAAAATPNRRRAPIRRTSPSTAPSTPKSNDRFPSSLLDGVVAKFLACTAPQHLPLLPITSSAESSTPLASWKTLHEAESLTVLQHPSTSGLYALCAQFPGVPVRKLYEVLINVGDRTTWDRMCQAAEEIEEVEVDVSAEKGAEGEEEGYRMLRGNVVWIGMKGMALLKPKDMVLLSIAGRLPSSTSSSSSEAPPTHAPMPPLQIFCATTSFSHPSVPTKSDFNRMELGISGFLLAEDGEGGSKIVQVTDLSGLGSWVPSAVIRTVTQKMLPKSLTKLGETAQALDLAVDSKYPLEGDAWMPPLLGEAVPLSSLPPTPHNTEINEEDSASSTLADSDSDGALDGDDGLRKGKERLPSAASAREIHTLVNQLRSVSARLNALEASSTGDQAGRKGWLASLPTILGGGGGGGVEQGQLQAFGGSKTVALTALGGAAGAAIVLGFLKGWERKRR